MCQTKENVSIPMENESVLSVEKEGVNKEEKKNREQCTLCARQAKIILVSSLTYIQSRVRMCAEFT